jgi:hypothetical protein
MKKAQINPSAKSFRGRAGSLAPISKGLGTPRKSSQARVTTRLSTLFPLFHRRQGWKDEKFSPDSMNKTTDLTRVHSEMALWKRESREMWTCDPSPKLDPEEGYIEELATAYYEKLLKVLSEGDFFEPLPQFPPDPSPSLKQLSEKLAATTASLLASMRPPPHSANRP